jgi:8-oxo-dGTP pyrophosphatase MutT (NUDIX family)
LFIFRHGKWDLPKGKKEANETDAEAAIREVMEETGISGLEIKKELQPTYHIYKIKGTRVLKKTAWYEMSCDETSTLTPQTIEDIAEVKWLNKKDIPWAMRNSFASIAELLTNAGYL